jgi:hypothetical protein
MAKKSDVFGGALEGWEPIDSPPRTLDSTTLSRQTDRVAQEFVNVARKYAQDETPTPTQASEHSSLVRAKKKGSLDNDVSAKTFVVSGNKIVGSQG